MASLQSIPDFFKEHSSDVQQANDRFESIISAYRCLFSRHEELGYPVLNEHNEGFERALAQMDSAMQFFKSYSQMCRETIDAFEEFENNFAHKVSEAFK